MGGSSIGTRSETRKSSTTIKVLKESHIERMTLAVRAINFDHDVSISDCRKRALQPEKRHMPNTSRRQHQKQQSTATERKKKSFNRVDNRTVSTRNKKKRLLSDGTNEAPATKTKKLANRKQSKDEYWSEFRHCLESADKMQVEDLAKDLFDQLWKTTGEKAALAITEQFKRKIKMAEETNERIADSMWVIDDGGTLTIDRDINYATFSNSSVHIYDFQITGDCSPASDTLVYLGNTDCWEDCHDDFRAELRLTYFANNDTVMGTIDGSPYRLVDCGSDSARGGVIEFTAKRKPLKAKENKHQRIADTFWKLNDGGLLTICAGIHDAAIELRNCSWNSKQIYGLTLSLDENPDILVYKSDPAICSGSYELTLEYNPERHTIKGRIEKNPHSSHNKEHIDFTARREVKISF